MRISNPHDMAGRQLLTGVVVDSSSFIGNGTTSSPLEFKGLSAVESDGSSVVASSVKRLMAGDAISFTSSGDALVVSASAGDANVIESVKLNGNALQVSEKSVNVVALTGVTVNGTAVSVASGVASIDFLSSTAYATSAGSVPWSGVTGAPAFVTFSAVDSLGQTGESNVVYLVPKAGSDGSNICDEYIWNGSKWELVGDTATDISNLVSKSFAINGKNMSGSSLELYATDIKMDNGASAKSVSSAIADIAGLVSSAGAGDMLSADFVNVGGTGVVLSAAKATHASSADAVEVQNVSGLDAHISSIKATSSSLGLVKIGSGITVDENGTINVNEITIDSSVASNGDNAVAGSAVYSAISAHNADSRHVPVSGTPGQVLYKTANGNEWRNLPTEVANAAYATDAGSAVSAAYATDAGLAVSASSASYATSAGEVNVSDISGLDMHISSIKATGSSLGLVQIGSGLIINESGVLSVEDQSLDPNLVAHYASMPSASENAVAIYDGDTTSDYEQGCIYKGVLQGGGMVMSGHYDEGPRQMDYTCNFTPYEVNGAPQYNTVGGVNCPIYSGTCQYSGTDRNGEPVSGSETWYMYVIDDEGYAYPNYYYWAVANTLNKDFISVYAHFNASENPNPVVSSANSAGSESGALGAGFWSAFSLVVSAGDAYWMKINPDMPQNVVECVESMPASAEAGKVVLYIGDTTSDYIQGRLYKGQNSTWNDITGPFTVRDSASSSITLSSMAAHTNYHYGTLTALTIIAVETSDLESTFNFVCDSGGCTLSLPASLNDEMLDPPVAGKRYVLSIRNGVAIGTNINA